MQAGPLYAFYHDNENGICQRVYERGRWSGALSAAMEAAPGFSVSLYGGVFYVFYKDAKGRAALISGDKAGYRRETVDNDATGHVCISKQGGMLTQLPFYTVKEDHFISCSVTSEGLTYKEFSYTTETEPQSVHIGSGVGDYSLIVTKERLHFLYLVKDRGKTRLIYKQRNPAGLTAGVVVWESASYSMGYGRAAESFGFCWLFAVRHRVYAAVMAGRDLLVSYSDDDGLNFAKPFKYLRKICDRPMKARYLTDMEMNENTFAACEVLVDEQAPSDVQVVPDIYPEFYLREFAPNRRSEQKDEPQPESPYWEGWYGQG